MAAPHSFPVQDMFKIRTPSMTVTITAEDLMIPPLSEQIPVPGNLVTIDSNPSVPPRSPTVTLEASPKSLSAPFSPSFAATSTDVPTHPFSTGFAARESSERRDSDSSIGDSLPLSSLLRRESSASIVFGPRRSSSKYADEVYGKVGAPPPIQPLDAEVIEERTAEGLTTTHDKALEKKDYTYWDKLRRRGTRTEIRRWHTFVPEGEEETAFYGHAIGVDVPVAAYKQGAYYAELDEGMRVKEYKLPTRSYVAPPVWIRRTKRAPLCDFSGMCSVPERGSEGGGSCGSICDCGRTRSVATAY